MTTMKLIKYEFFKGREKMLYFKIKKAIEGRLSFDVLVGRYQVHYNYYEHSIEIKENFQFLEKIEIKPFLRYNKKWKEVLCRAFNC